MRGQLDNGHRRPSYLRPFAPCPSYEVAHAAATDAANHQAKVNHRAAWNQEDYSLACRTLAQLWPTSGYNHRAGLANE